MNSKIKMLKVFLDTNSKLPEREIIEFLKEVYNLQGENDARLSENLSNIKSSIYKFQKVFSRGQNYSVTDINKLKLILFVLKEEFGPVQLERILNPESKHYSQFNYREGRGMAKTSISKFLESLREWIQGESPCSDDIIKTFDGILSVQEMWVQYKSEYTDKDVLKEQINILKKREYKNYNLFDQVLIRLISNERRIYWRNLFNILRQVVAEESFSSYDDLYVLQEENEIIEVRDISNWIKENLEVVTRIVYSLEKPNLKQKKYILETIKKLEAYSKICIYLRTKSLSCEEIDTHDIYAMLRVLLVEEKKGKKLELLKSSDGKLFGEYKKRYKTRNQIFASLENSITEITEVEKEYLGYIMEKNEFILFKNIEGWKKKTEELMHLSLEMEAIFMEYDLDLIHKKMIIFFEQKLLKDNLFE